MANREQPIELFMPPNILKAKVGGNSFTGMDMAAIQRAEAALEELKSEFAGWAADDVKRLEEAREAFAKAPDVKTRAALLRAAHDMKGQAATFNFPLIARVAGSLSKMIHELSAEKDVPSADDDTNSMSDAGRDHPPPFTFWVGTVPTGFPTR